MNQLQKVQHQNQIEVLPLKMILKFGDKSEQKKYKKKKHKKKKWMTI